VPGTAKNYDVTHIHQGPGDLWIIGSPPVDSATPQLTLYQDGTPDSTAHPGSIHLGGTDSAVTIAVTPKIEDIKLDQIDAPVAWFLAELEMSLEAELKQLDPAIMQEALPFGVYASAAPPGYKQLTFGGQPIPAAGIAVACIAPKRAGTGKFIVSLLFNALGMLGMNFAVGRAKPTMYKAQFRGMADLSRAAGRQVGVFYETT
jgi:hypothetical protein